MNLKALLSYLLISLLVAAAFDRLWTYLVFRDISLLRVPPLVHGLWLGLTAAAGLLVAGLLILLLRSGPVSDPPEAWPPARSRWLAGLGSLIAYAIVYPLLWN